MPLIWTPKPKGVHLNLNGRPTLIMLSRSSWITSPLLVVIDYHHCALNVYAIRILEKENWFVAVSWKEEKFENHCNIHPINISSNICFASAKKRLYKLQLHQLACLLSKGLTLTNFSLITYINSTNRLTPLSKDAI